jgi:SNF2 family DNA or RNA helicase
MKQLYEYQKKYIAGLPKDCIMGADVGLGKTIMSLAHYLKYGEGRPLLVLAPASKVKTGDWQREIEDFFGLAQPEWWVVSYDKFARKPENYLGVKDIVVIADECHFVCNSQSKRSKAVRKIKMISDQFIGLSATPLPNGWSSLENYAIMFGLVKNKTEYLSRFVNIDRSKGFPIITGYNGVDVLTRFWNRHSKHLDRNGNIDLPEVMKLPERIQMGDDFKANYGHMMRTRTTADGELLDNPSKYFNALRQELTPLRRDALQSILESTREHIVVFYNYDAERELILDVASKLDKANKRVVYEQSGHVSNLPKREIWETMKPSITLAQYQSASTAIELTYASVTIFLSPTYSYSNFHQAQGRTHRPGQKKRVLFYMFSVDGSIDQAVWLALRKKQNFNDRIWLVEQPEMDGGGIIMKSD